MQTPRGNQRGSNLSSLRCRYARAFPKRDTQISNIEWRAPNKMKC